jgi:hypothetical protein
MAQLLASFARVDIEFNGDVNGDPFPSEGTPEE